MALSHINSVSLFDEARGWRVLHDGTEDPSSSVEVVTVPSSQGVTDAGGGARRHEGQQFGLHFQVRGSARAETEMASEDLRALLRSPSLVARRFAVQHQEAALLLHTLVPTERVTCTHHRIRGVFSIPGVFFRDPSPVEVTVPAGTSAQVALAGSGPITDAVVRFAGAAGEDPHRTLVDATTGTGITTYHQGAGGYAYVDLASMRSWHSSSATAWTPPSGALGLDQFVTYPPAGPLQLWPTFDGHTRSVVVQASQPATIRARRAWL